MTKLTVDFVSSAKTPKNKGSRTQGGNKSPGQAEIFRALARNTKFRTT